MEKKKVLPEGTIVDGIDCGGMTENPKLTGIPVYLQVQNRKALTPDQAAKVEEYVKKGGRSQNVVTFGKPKGMPAEEWEALQSRERQLKREAKEERLSSLPKKPKPKKAPLPEDSFTLRGWAAELGFDPRLVRRVARENKDKLKVLEIAGKYVYSVKSKDEVARIIKEGLAEPGKSSSGKKKVPAKKIPADGVFVGKAKVKRTNGDAPKPSSAKGGARKEAEEAMKGRKKIPVKDGSIYVKKLARRKAV